MTLTIRERLTGVVQSRTIKELIGRVVIAGLWNRRMGNVSVDQSQPDYQFFDYLRRGKAKGYELAGLLAAPVAGIIAAWVLGNGPKVKLVDAPDQDAEEDDPLRYTETSANRFLRRVRGLLIQVIVDLYSLGNQYVIVNPDGSLSVPSPDTVEKFIDDIDYRRAVRYVVTTKLTTVTIRDEYRLDGRTISLQNTNPKNAVVFNDVPIPAGKTVDFEFENLIGRLPVVHFTNDKGVNETHGRPLVEPMLPLLSRYNDLLTKALDGAEMLGNPIPVFEGMEDVEETVNANSEPVDDDWQDEDGTTRSRTRIVWDRMTAIILGKGGHFQFAGPSRGFTEDIKGLLKVLFLIVLEFTRIPEVVWGGELGQARASATEQLKTFFMHITSKRLEVEGEGADEMLAAEANGGLLELLDIWLKTRALVDAKIQSVPVALEWPELGEKSDELTLKWALEMSKAGVITDETFVTLSERIQDPAAEVEAAKEQNDERQAAEDERRAAMLPDIETMGMEDNADNPADMNDQPMDNMEDEQPVEQVA